MAKQAMAEEGEGWMEDKRPMHKGRHRDAARPAVEAEVAVAVAVAAEQQQQQRQTRRRRDTTTWIRHEVIEH